MDTFRYRLTDKAVKRAKYEFSITTEKCQAQGSPQVKDSWADNRPVWSEHLREQNRKVMN